MRVPDNIKFAVCFLCVESGGRTLYGGTGFFVEIKSPNHDDLLHRYLVTAKHCVERAFSRYGNLSCRINVENDGARLISLPDWSEWIFSETADVAVLPFQFSNDLDYAVLGMDTFLTDNVIRTNGIGIGDELFIVGLFTQRHGTQRNIPIVRSGIIAAMPEEPLLDDNTGQEYSAYLIEARSIGGLSGSPVFMALPRVGVAMHPAPRGFNPMTHALVLLGLVRGHWDLNIQKSAIDFSTDQDEKLNMGIALVTPIQEVFAIMNDERLTSERKKKAKDYMKQARRSSG